MRRKHELRCHSTSSCIDSGHLLNNHGQMTAVIRYYTLYLVNNKDPLNLLFVLGNDMSLSSVRALPTLLSTGATIDLSRGTLSYSELNFNSPFNSSSVR